MLTALALALQVLEALPTLITTTAEVSSLIASTVATLKQMQAQGRDPTATEWDAIHAQIDALRTVLDAPEDAPVVVPAAAAKETGPLPGDKPDGA